MRASSDALYARLLAAVALVFAMPMYNWSMPSAFKAFIDSITRTGVTYLHTEDGGIVGQLGRHNGRIVDREARRASQGDRHGAAAPAARAQRCVRTADDTRN
ncbi:FMN-dependent NADH-azoreductase [Paraburkholderia sp. WSM4179]|nr:FMN-dependent NADH-azoreductase [Paraburkholderia sp. WSM4179]